MPIRLEESLPRIPVPLREREVEPPLDLQYVFQQAYVPRLQITATSVVSRNNWRSVYCGGGPLGNFALCRSSVASCSGSIMEDVLILHHHRALALRFGRVQK